MKPKTPLGIELRNYRLDNSETQGELADALEVSSAYLSAIESGEKSATEGLLAKIITHYQIGDADGEVLRQISIQSQRVLKLDIAQEPEKTRKLVAMFARNFSSLTNSKQDQIIKILEGQESA